MCNPKQVSTRDSRTHTRIKIWNSRLVMPLIHFFSSLFTLLTDLYLCTNRTFDEFKKTKKNKNALSVPTSYYPTQCPRTDSRSDLEYVTLIIYIPSILLLTLPVRLTRLDQVKGSRSRSFPLGSYHPQYSPSQRE